MIYPINHLPDSIPIGIQTEQGVELIGFDLKSWLDAFPGMSFQVCHTRPGENEAYPVNDFVMVGTVLYWHPDGYDTAVAGEGKVEIVGVGDNRRKLSGFVPTFVTATSLGANKEPGENVAPWYEAVLQAAQDIGEKVDVGDGGLFLVGVNRNVSPSRLTRKYSEISAAIDAGDTCLLCNNKNVYLCRGYGTHPKTNESCIVFMGDIEFNEKYGSAPMYVYVSQDGTITETGRYVKTPNPQALIVKYSEATTTYNGAEQKTIDLTGIAGDAADIVIIKTKSTSAGVFLADHGHSEIEEALSAGKLCLLLHGGTVYPYNTFEIHNNERCAAFYGWTDIRADAGAAQMYAYINPDGVVTVEGSYVKIPNPHALAIRKGETIMTYNGSKGVTVDTLPTPTDTASVAYSRWNGSAWEAATIAQLKADLGL